MLILTTFGRPGYLRRAVEAGAAGFLVKDGPVEELAAAVRRVPAGETVADIAARLHLSESTVRNYLSSAIGKTATRNRMEALRQARRQGWL